MSLLVVGTVGIDTVETPVARRDNVLGGSASFFAFAASYFTRVSLVSVVGTDFPAEYKALLASRNIDLAGLVVAEGKTFAWHGKYHENMSDRDTLDVHLNTFEKFNPVVPERDRNSDFVFLANGSPSVQFKILKQMKKWPKFVAADTMNLWIETTRDELDELLRHLDALLINDSEARLYTGERELLRAGKALITKGPGIIIIKKGEHGALVVTKSGNFYMPAYPLEEVADPTGAGDSFAGALMGYLDAQGSASRDNLRRALAYGTVVASFTCQGFSFDALKKTTREDIEARYKELLEMTQIPK
jgi:sugar/nucleoside kinase (ribokinase family)